MAPASRWGKAGALHHRSAGSGFAVDEQRHTDRPLVAHHRHFRRRATLHDMKKGSKAVLGDVHVSEPIARLVQHLADRHRHQLRLRPQPLRLRPAQGGQQQVLRRRLKLRHRGPRGSAITSLPTGSGPVHRRLAQGTIDALLSFLCALAHERAVTTRTWEAQPRRRVARPSRACDTGGANGRGRNRSGHLANRSPSSAARTAYGGAQTQRPRPSYSFGLICALQAGGRGKLRCRRSSPMSIPTANRGVKVPVAAQSAAQRRLDHMQQVAGDGARDVSQQDPGCGVARRPCSPAVNPASCQRHRSHRPALCATLTDLSRGGCGEAERKLGVVATRHGG